MSSGLECIQRELRMALKNLKLTHSVTQSDFNVRFSPILYRFLAYCTGLKILRSERAVPVRFRLRAPTRYKHPNSALAIAEGKEFTLLTKKELHQSDTIAVFHYLTALYFTLRITKTITML